MKGNFALAYRKIGYFSKRWACLSIVLGPLLFGIATSDLKAQAWTIEGGIAQGFYNNDLSPPEGLAWRSSSLQPILAFHSSLNDQWSLGLEFSSGNWSGRDRDFPDSTRQLRGLSFETSFTTIGLPVRYRFLKGRVRPYLSFTPGLIFFRPQLDPSSSRLAQLFELFAMDQAMVDRETQLFIGLGGGFQWQLKPNWSLRFGASAASAFNDYLDGLSLGGNPNSNDSFGSIEVTVSHHLSIAKDQDRDGIADRFDVCPTEPGPRSLEGCPDTDGDGIRDAADVCPLVAGSIAFAGCPDTDQDGIPDYRDLCPQEAGTPGRNGCPEKEIDSDGDGLSDDRDACPQEAGPIERGGCPSLDSDRDGILDEDDHCPFRFGLSVFYGCPDSDGDGIADDRDACPYSFGVYDEFGCPLVSSTAEEASYLNEQYIPFPFNSSYLTHFRLLDKIADFLVRQEAYQLHLQAFANTDDIDEKEPLSLAAQRALVIIDYLKRRGIAASRLSYETLAAKGPSDQNTSAAQRELKRRVQFIFSN